MNLITRACTPLPLSTDRLDSCSAVLQPGWRQFDATEAPITQRKMNGIHLLT
jgi:hypothetical protein